jgi:hypothetical protein
MFRRITAALLALCLTFLATAAFAVDAPELLARSSGNVNINREGSENPVMEVARSTFWGATAGTLIGLAISVAQDGSSGEPVRWGFVLGTFGGLATGIYFVSQRPQPSSLLELKRDGLSPGSAATAIEVAPNGGVRVRAIGVRF